MTSKLLACVLVFLGLLAGASAQGHQCPENAHDQDCTGCTAGEGDVPEGSTFSAVASPCVETPTSDCVACCWDLSFHIGPATSVDYTSTFIKIGGNAKKFGASPSVIITDTATLTCDRTSEKIACVRFEEHWHPSTTSWKVKCIELVCGLCPGGVDS